MELSELQTLLALANESGSNRSEVFEKLHTLKGLKNRLIIGLDCFVHGSQQQVQFFGLSLLRECLQLSHPDEVGHRRAIRDTLLPYLENKESYNSEVPSYFKNSILSILALLIKWDYPDFWPTAFQDLLQLSRSGGLKNAVLLITVLQELEIEVVAFSDSRSREEIARNTQVKDVMRSSGTTFAVTEFLCEVIASVSNSLSRALSVSELRVAEDVGRKALMRLSELFSWIDVSIVAQALPTVSSCAQLHNPNFSLRVEAFVCFRELMRRGMDPKTRLTVLKDLQLIPFIASVPVCLPISGAKVNSDIPERELEAGLQYGRIIDLIITEFTSFVATYEDAVFPLKSSATEFATITGIYAGAVSQGSNSTNYLDLVIPFLSYLNESLVALMKVFVVILANDSVSIALTLAPSLQRILALMKQHSARLSKFGDSFLAATSRTDFAYFNSVSYLSDIQDALLRQSFYPDDMDFGEIEDDEELQALIEEKREIRRLFLCFAKLDGAAALTKIATLLVSQTSFELRGIQYEALFRLLISSSEFQADQLKDFPSFILYIMNIDRQKITHVESKIAFVELLIKFQSLSSLDGRKALMQVILEGLGTLLPSSSTAIHQSKNNIYYLQEIQVKYAQALLKLVENISANADGNQDKEALFLQSKDVLARVIVESMTALCINSEAVTSTQINLSDSSSSRLKKRNPKDQAIFLIFEVIGMLVYHKEMNNGGEAAIVVPALQLQYFNQMIQFVFELSNQILLQAQQSNQINQEAFEAMLVRVLVSISCIFKHIAKASLSYFPSALELNHRLVQNLLQHPFTQQAENVRVKILTLLHLFMSSTDAGIYQSFLQPLQVMVRSIVSVREMESLSQLLIQIMSNHSKEVVLPLLLEAFPVLARTTLQFNLNLEAQLSNQQLKSHTFEHEISALENDRVSSFRTLLSILQQITTSRIDAILFLSDQSALSHEFPHLLNLIIGIFNEVSPTNQKFLRSSCVPLKRLCCSIVNAFVSSWLVSPDLVLALPQGSQSNRNVLETFLYEKWIPLIFINISPAFVLRSEQSAKLLGLIKTSLSSSFPESVINCKDAATQPILGEIATLIYLLLYRSEGAGSSEITRNEQFLSYLSGLMIQLDWPKEYQQPLIDILCSQHSPNLSSFKEIFQKFVRSHLTSL